MAGRTTSWLVIAFDASGYPSQIEKVSSSKDDAKDQAHEWEIAGNDWVRVFTVTSPVVPHGEEG